MPGKQIVFYNGLVQAVLDQNEFVGVLSHELGHVEHRHAMKGVAHAVGVGAVLSFMMGGADMGGSVLSAVNVISVVSYSRDKEHEASCSLSRE